MLEEMEEIVKEINLLDRQIAEKGITREEHALLTAMQKHLPHAEEKDLINFVQNLLSSVETGLFGGWQRKTTTIKEVERTVFDNCFKTFSKTIDPKSIVQLAEELVGFIKKYHP